MVRDRLAEDDLDCVPVTSGSKGLHLYAELDAGRTHQQVRDYAKGIAEELEKAQPKLVVSQMTKARRGGKVFLDWSQNTGSKTTISPYSLRGRELPMVAAPRTWDEVEAGAEDPLALEQLRFEEVLERVQDEGDLFELEA
jgi:bifunctional non-homologous end joining protein LigD